MQMHMERGRNAVRFGVFASVVKTTLERAGQLRL